MDLAWQPPDGSAVKTHIGTMETPGSIIVVLHLVPESSIERLRQAKGNFQFGRGMDDLKDVLPTSLLIDGMHNPMRLLHDALSRSVHQDSDQQCLERAIHARRILFDMAERIARARRADSELKQSVAALMSQRPKPS